MGLLVLVSACTLLAGMDWYRSFNAHSDSDLLVTALQHARAESMHNTCLGSRCVDGAPHGVAVRPSDHPNAYIIFQGPSYAARDASADVILEASPASAATGLAEVVFAPGSGDVSAPGDIVLAEAGRTTTITVGSEGQISWTH